MFSIFSEAKKQIARTSAENFAITQVANYFHMKTVVAGSEVEGIFPTVWMECKEAYDNSILSKYDITFHTMLSFAAAVNEGSSVPYYAQAVSMAWCENNMNMLHPDTQEFISPMVSYYVNKYSPKTTKNNEVLQCSSCNQYIWANPTLVNFWCKRCGTQNNKIRW